MKKVNNKVKTNESGYQLTLEDRLTNMKFDLMYQMYQLDKFQNEMDGLLHKMGIGRSVK